MSFRKILIGYQMRWITDTAPVTVWEKSRRIGASWGDALKSVLAASKKRSEGGMNCYYLSYNKDMTRQYVQDCAYWAKLINAAAGEVEEIVLKDEDKDITIFQIRFASDFVIQALPSEARNIRSKQGRIIIDEAAFVEDLGELLKAALALLMWGGCVAILSTHDGVDNPFNELCRDVEAGRVPYALHRTDFDEALEEGLYRAICRKTKTKWTPEGEAEFRQQILAYYKDNADEELFCIPRRSAGPYLPSALIEACMDKEIPVLRFTPPAEDFVDWELDRAEKYVIDWLQENVDPILKELPAASRHFFGMDFGRSGDLSVFWPLTEEVNLDLATPFVLEMRNCPFRTQELILNHIAHRLPRFSGGALDARGNGQAVAEFARQEFGPELILEVMLSEKDYRENFPKVKAGLEDRSITLPSDSHIRDDLRCVKLVRGVPRIPEARGKDDTGGRHGDAAVALMLAKMATTLEAEADPWEPVSAGEREAASLLAGF